MSLEKLTYFLLLATCLFCFSACVEQDEIEVAIDSYSSDFSILMFDIKENGLESERLTDVSTKMRTALSDPESLLGKLQDLTMMAYREHAGSDPDSEQILSLLSSAKEEFRYGNIDRASEQILSASSIMLCSKLVYAMPGSITTQGVLHLTGYDEIYDIQEMCYGSVASSPGLVSNWVASLVQK